MVNPIYAVLDKRNDLTAEEKERIFYEMKCSERKNMKRLFEKIKDDFSKEIPGKFYDYRSKILAAYWEGYDVAIDLQKKNPKETGIFYAEYKWDQYAASDIIPWEIRKATEEWLNSFPENYDITECKIMIYYFVEIMCKCEICSYSDLLFYIIGLR